MGLLLNNQNMFVIPFFKVFFILIILFFLTFCIFSLGRNLWWCKYVEGLKKKTKKKKKNLFLPSFTGRVRTMDKERRGEACQRVERERDPNPKTTKRTRARKEEKRRMGKGEEGAKKKRNKGTRIGEAESRVQREVCGLDGNCY